MSVVLHTDSTDYLSGASYIGYLGCGWYMLMKMTSHGYTFTYRIHLFLYWIPLVLVMFSPVSMATNGNDSFIFSMHSYLKEKLYTLLCAVIIVFICLYLKTEPIINCSVYCEVPGVQI